VLLYDEGSCAEAADSELLVALARDLLDDHIGDVGPTRAIAEKCDEGLDGGGRPLGVHGYGPVLAVAHPAEHAELMRSLPRCVAKADPLDAPCNPHTNCPGSGRIWQSDLCPQGRALDGDLLESIDRRGGVRELQCAVLDRSELQAHDVERIVLVEPPRRPGALLGELVDRAQHIA